MAPRVIRNYEKIERHISYQYDIASRVSIRRIGSKLVATSAHSDVLDAVAKIGRSAILTVDRQSDCVIIYL